MGWLQLKSGWVALLLAGLLPSCVFIKDFDEFTFSTDPGRDASTDVPVDPEDADPCALAPCECLDDADCTAPFQFCDQTGPGSRCACVKGYEMGLVEVPVDGGAADAGAGDGGADDGGGFEPDYEEGCVWAGVVEDPGFADPNAWTARRGALVNPTAEGPISDGEGLYSANTVCNMGSLSQEICVPPLERAQPLQVEVTYLSSSGDYGPAVGAAVGFDGFWNELRSSYGSWTTHRVCLGEAAYGNTLEFSVAPNQTRMFECSTTLTVNHADIVVAPDGDCPAPGAIRNADFEDEGGWATSGRAAIEEGVGQASTRGLRLWSTHQCQSSSATGVGSWPLPESQPNLAIQFWSQGTAGRHVRVRLGDAFPTTIGAVWGTGAPTFHTVCLPPWAHGLATEVTFSLPQEGSGCTIEDERDFRIDDLTLVSNPVCDADPYLLNGGFEHQADGISSGWFLLSSANGNVTADLVSDTSAARTGAGALRLTATSRCEGASGQSSIRVPEPMADAGPAVRFWYRTESLTNASTGASIAGEEVGPLPAADEWTEHVGCVRPAQASRSAEVRFWISGGGGLCADTYAAERVFVDDVEAFVHEDCPSE